MKAEQELICDHISISYFDSDKNHDAFKSDHCHDKYEITYLLSASGKYTVEGSEHTVAPGTLLFINPMSYHKVELNTDVYTEGYTVHFSLDALSPSVTSILLSLADDGKLGGLVFTKDFLSDNLVNCFERFSVCERLNEVESAAYMQAILSEIIILLSAAEGERITHLGEELGARVTSYLNDNIEKSVSLDKLARRFFVSKYYLCRAFKSYSGISIHAYVNQKRIMYAKQLIASGMTASHAAERVGFGDYSAFYRAYTKIVGKSPTAQ